MAGFDEMPSTMWTAIYRAREQGSEILDELLRRYRPPVLSFIRSTGIKPEEAEDMTQEVFLAILEDDILRKADRNRGRFRSFLLTVTRYTVASKLRDAGRQKRGGNVKKFSFDPALEQGPASTERDEQFDFLWIENLIRIAMGRLREESEAEDNQYFAALHHYTTDQLSYAEIAKRLGVSGNDIKNYIHQARGRLRRHVLNEIRNYSSSTDEYEAEVEYLKKFLE